MAEQERPYEKDDSGYGKYERGQMNFYKATIPKPAYAYPADLLNTMKGMPFIHLNVVDSVALKRSKFAVGLPFPTSVKVSYNANWESINLGAFTGALTRAAEDAKRKWGEQGWMDMATSTAKRVGVGMLAGVANAAGQTADEFTLLNAQAGAEIAARAQVNPHAALRFMGMAFREFILDFVLLPKNEKESEEIKNIIFQLKYAMHPEGSGGGAAQSAYFSYPNEFIIGFYAPNLKNLFRTSPCELISCSIEYAGAGVPAFFRDDKPVCLLLSLHFKESEILTKERITQGW